MPAARRASKKRSRLRRGNLLTSLVLVLPLLALYEIGVLFTDVLNGADFVTGALVRALGLRGFVILQVGLLAGAAGIALYLRRRQEFDPRMIVPVLLESGIYALTMGTLIIFVMVDLLRVDPRLAAAPAARSLLDKLVLSLGAGVWEELVFRLLALGGLAWLFDRALKLRSWIAIVLAFALSSVLFAAAHHAGPHGEPFRLGAMVYRTCAGLVFATLYQLRGFAIAVYTHTLYDVYVLVLH